MFRMGLLGKKLGVTQIFTDDGLRICVTAVQLGPCTIVQKKTPDSKDGYGAIQIGWGEKPHKKVTKALRGHYERADVKPALQLKELRCDDESKLSEFEVGQVLDVNTFFKEGEFIDVTATSKGKGFQGVIKLHNMKGAKQKTHGTHEQFRHVGSIGCRTTPGEVNKGKRLPKRMGNETVTTQNLRIVKIDAEKNIALISGSVPGARNGAVLVRQSVKKHGKVATF